MSSFKESNPKVDSIEDELNLLIDEGLKLTPLMKGISFKFLGFINLGQTINKMFSQIHRSSIKLGMTIKALQSAIKKEPTDSME